MSNDIIISTGYNGAPRQALHCTDAGCLMIDGHCKRAVHAEVNALANAARKGIATDGATAYVTTLPCMTCLSLLKQAGIQKIWYLEEYPHEEAQYVRECPLIERMPDYDV